MSCNKLSMNQHALISFLFILFFLIFTETILIFSGLLKAFQFPDKYQTILINILVLVDYQIMEKEFIKTSAVIHFKMQYLAFKTNDLNLHNHFQTYRFLKTKNQP